MIASQQTTMIASQQTGVSHLQIMFLLVLHNDCTMYVKRLLKIYIYHVDVYISEVLQPNCYWKSEAGKLTMSIYAASSGRRMPAVNHLIEPTKV